MTRLATLALALSLTAPSAFAASMASDDAGSTSQSQVRGTVQGEVKEMQGNSVVIETDGATDGESKEARLTLHESTHMGPIKKGDLVVAYVTPGGTTTSIQPLDSRWYQ